MKKIFFGGAINYKNSITSSFGKLELEVVENLSKSVDIVYWVYGAGPNLLSNIRLWLNKKPFLILHWIGTDVLVWNEKIKNGRLKSKLYYQIWKLLIKYKQKRGSLINLSGAEWLKDELEEIGISSIVLPITTINEDLIKIDSGNTNRNIDFISYTPFARFEFYGGTKILELAELLPEYNFLLILPDISEIKANLFKKIPKNVNLSAQINFDEMQKLLRNSKCFLRFTKHDGLSLSVLESLLANTHVLWTHEFPFTQKINLNSNKNDILKQLMIIISNWQLNQSGRDFVIKNFVSSKFVSNFNTIFNEIPSD
jgi:hypothetical protein